MKIKKDIPFDILEEYGYYYKQNIVYPTYQKIIEFGSSFIVIDIFLMNRCIYINNKEKITNKNIKFIRDIIKDNLTVE